MEKVFFVCVCSISSSLQATTIDVQAKTTADDSNYRGVLPEILIGTSPQMRNLVIGID